MMLTELKSKWHAHMGGLLILSVVGVTNAGDVKIVAAEFSGSGASQWSVSVTLEHEDTGWDHYADAWRVVDSEGNVLGNRELLHPHVDEQPFACSLSGITVPGNVRKVFIEAHDKIHGWTKRRLLVDLARVKDGQLKVLSDY